MTGQVAPFLDQLNDKCYDAMLDKVKEREDFFEKQIVQFKKKEATLMKQLDRLNEKPEEADNGKGKSRADRGKPKTKAEKEKEEKERKEREREEELRRQKEEEARRIAEEEQKRKEEEEAKAKAKGSKKPSKPTA